MTVQYHKYLDRILVRRAAETESLEKQVDANRPAPKIVLGLFCFGLAGMALVFVPGLFPLWLIPGLGGVISWYGAFSVWRQVRKAETALAVEQNDEDYRRYLLAKLGAAKFDQLVVAVGAGGSDASVTGWLKPLGFDEHDVEYLLWLAEALLESMGGAPRAQRKPAAATTPAPAAPMIADITPPVIPVAELAERAASEPSLKSVERGERSMETGQQSVERGAWGVEEKPQSDSAPQAPDSAPGTPDLKRLSDDEIAKFKQLAAQRKQEYQQWLASGGRDTDPDDPFGKLKDFSPEKIAELKRKAQERRKAGAAPVSNAPAAGAEQRGVFDEREMSDLARKALSRFEPKPVSGVPKQAPGTTLGEVFDADELARLKDKAERERANRPTEPAKDDDPDWDEQGREAAT